MLQRNALVEDESLELLGSGLNVPEIVQVVAAAVLYYHVS